MSSTLGLLTRGFLGGGGGGGSTTGSIISITHGTLGRWTPVVAKIQITGGVPFIRYVSDSLVFWLYDPVDGFKNNFKARSSVELVDDEYTFSILPNGGWWTSQFSLKFVAGVELSQE